MVSFPLVLCVLALAQTAAAPLKVPFPDALQAGWKGKPVCERLREDDQSRILRCTFPPKGGHDIHYHRPHFGYALSGGRMRIVDANGVRESILETGSNFTSAGVQWHEVTNVGETTVQYLIVESKAKDKPKAAADQK